LRERESFARQGSDMAAPNKNAATPPKGNCAQTCQEVNRGRQEDRQGPRKNLFTSTRKMVKRKKIDLRLVGKGKAFENPPKQRTRGNRSSEGLYLCGKLLEKRNRSRRQWGGTKKKPPVPNCFGNRAINNAPGKVKGGTSRKERSPQDQAS